MEDREFYVIVKNIDGLEETEEYENLDEARTDYVNFVNNETNYNYIVLQQVKIEDDSETIDEIDKVENDKPKIPNDYFWNMIDEYESIPASKRTVSEACDMIVDAYSLFKIKDLDEAIADYELLTSNEATSYVKRYLEARIY